MQRPKATPEVQRGLNAFSQTLQSPFLSLQPKKETPAPLSPIKRPTNPSVFNKLPSQKTTKPLSPVALPKPKFLPPFSKTKPAALSPLSKPSTMSTIERENIPSNLQKITSAIPQDKKSEPSSIDREALRVCQKDLKHKDYRIAELIKNLQEKEATLAQYKQEMEKQQETILSITSQMNSQLEESESMRVESEKALKEKENLLKVNGKEMTLLNAQVQKTNEIVSQYSVTNLELKNLLFSNSAVILKMAHAEKHRHCNLSISELFDRALNEGVHHASYTEWISKELKNSV